LRSPHFLRQKKLIHEGIGGVHQVKHEAGKKSDENLTKIIQTMKSIPHLFIMKIKKTYRE